MEDDGMTAVGPSEQHYDLVVRPTVWPLCDCAAGPGPPPPRFLLPPPPVDRAWAAAGRDICDIVTPLQVCRAHSGLSAGADPHPSPSMPMLAALITTSLFLFIVLVAGTIFFCKHRRKLGGLEPGKGGDKRGESSRMLYDDLSRRPRATPTGPCPSGSHIEMLAVKGGGRCRPRLVPGGRPGTLFLYPPAPSLADDRSERLSSHVYEEIPYHGGPTPSVSCCSDSEDEVISHLSAEGDPPAAGGGGPEPRYVCSLQTGPPRHRRPAPSGPRRHPALRRKDPYYYSDLPARHGDVSCDVTGSGPDRTPPCDEELACRMASGPFSDLFGGGQPSRGPRRPPHKLTSFGGPADPTDGELEVYVNSTGPTGVSWRIPVNSAGSVNSASRLAGSSGLGESVDWKL